MKKLTFINYAILILITSPNAQPKEFPELIGPYLGQSPPGNIPEIFAPDFFDSFMYVRDAAFTPDGKEFFFTSLLDNQYSIMHSVCDSIWSAPAAAFFSGIHNDFEPCVSSDGQKLFFASGRPSETKFNMENDTDIWYLQLTDGIWSEPRQLDSIINSRCMEYYPSVSSNGNIYFGRNDEKLTRGDIYFSRHTGSGFQKPVKLPEVINLPNSSFNACIAPDESFLIFSYYIQSDSTWHSDLFISFKDGAGNWSGPVNLGNDINTIRNESSPVISHDGRYLFYSSYENDKSNIYWVSANIIEELRPKK